MQSGLSARLNRLLRDERAALAAGAFGLLLAAALFQFAIGWDAVAAGGAIWRDPPGPIARALAAAEAILREGWTFPLAAASSLAAPGPMPAVEAGAPAWAILGVKALGLGAWVNPLGAWQALAWLAQPLSMIALLRAMGARRWPTLAAGAALSLLAPPWIAPQAIVPTSSGFVILSALALSLAAARRGLTPRKILGFGGLAALAAGLPGGGLVPVVLLFIAAAAAEIAEGRAGAGARVAGGAVRLGLAAGVAGFLLNGGLPLSGAPAPIYPGAGVLLAATVAAGVWIAARRSAGFGAWRRFGPPLVLLAGLAVWALAGAERSGPPGPWRLEAAFLEAPAYAALALALTALDKAWRPRWSLAVLAAALALQAADAGGGLGRLRAETHAVPSPDLSSLRAPAMAGRPWVLLEPCQVGPGGRALRDRLALIAARNGGSALEERGCPPPAERLWPAAPHDPRLVAALAGSDAALAGRPDCRRLERLLVCGRGVGAAAPRAELRRPFVVDFTGGGVGLGGGWSTPEPQGVWSAKPLAGVTLLTPVYGPEGMVLEFDLQAYAPPGAAAQTVGVSHESVRLTRWEVAAAGPATYRLEVPPGLARPGERFAVEFYIRDPVPVSQIVPGSTDERRLGVFLRRARVSPLRPAS